MADAARIKGRAVRRCGELLKQVEPKPGARTDKEPRGHDSPRLATRESVASAAGLSVDQQKQALRIASIPKRDFEAAIEAEVQHGQ